MSQFVPLETPNESPATNILQGLTQDDLHTIQRESIHVFPKIEEYTTFIVYLEVSYFQSYNATGDVTTI